MIHQLIGTALVAASVSAFAGTTAGSASGRSVDPMAGATFGNPPPASVIVTQGGLEWIWAAPCSEGAGSCGAPTHHSGFRTPTASEWGSWANLSQLVGAFAPGGSAICGSPWMSAFHNHCDVGDLTNGHVWHATGLCNPAYFNGCEAGTTESFLVRAVPEPETYALMIAGLGLVGWMARRRKAA